MLALLDTGCDRSLIGRRLLPPGFQVTPTKGRLFAANKTEIPVHGEIELPFHVGERQLSAVVSVTDVVDELILGIESVRLGLHERKSTAEWRVGQVVWTLVSGQGSSNLCR